MVLITGHIVRGTSISSVRDGFRTSAHKSRWLRALGGKRCGLGGSPVYIWEVHRENYGMVYKS